MNLAIQRRGGTTAQHSTFIGLDRELTVDTTKHTVVVHDGVTAGGIPLATEQYVDSGIAAAIEEMETYIEDTIGAALAGEY